MGGGAIWGITYNFENTATDYQSGMEFHVDWAIGKDFGNGLTLVVVGYNYRQLTPDSGAGATLGDFMGSVDAIGLGVWAKRLPCSRSGTTRSSTRSTASRVRPRWRR